MSVSSPKTAVDKTKDNTDEKKSVDESPTQDYIRVALLTSLALYLRIMILGYPHFITEIELEATRQVNWYMSGKFFIGKFPPLMGLLSAGLARTVGYYGTEDLLYAGQPFIEFPLVALRRLSALLGTCLIPLCYMTLRHMNHSRSTATLASALLIFENGTITQSRFATPEIYVLFFSALVTFSWTLMQKHSQQSQGQLTTSYGVWQTITGISMGLAISSKWTGVLVFPVVWTSVIIETWKKLCEKQNSVKSIFRHVFIYFLTLGLLPLSVYLTIFQFHLNLIPNTGDHDLLVSPKLKYSLQGNQAEPTQPNIAFGSQITIKHIGTVGGFLHSHYKRFSGGSTQQEVTLYPYVDLNNIWTVHKNVLIWNESHPIEFVRNGDQIRLEHFASNRKLHSHDIRPQLTGKQEHSEVTAYGDRYVMDSHDYWNLQILNDDGTPSDDKTLTWKPLTQKFRLQHIRGCMLVSHHSWYLPPLGEGHQEVTCMASAGEHIMSWQVESSYHEQLEGMKAVSYEKMSTIEKLAEVHHIMSKYPPAIHNRLQSSAEDVSAYSKLFYNEETPYKWFFKRSSEKIWSELAGFSAHLVLNPMLQKLIVVSLVFYILSLSIYAFAEQRQIKVLLASWLDTMTNMHYTHSIVTFYAPIIIHLQLLSFLPHHVTCMSDILPVMYYGASLVSVMLESCSSIFQHLPSSSLCRRLIGYGLLLATIIPFSKFSRLAYGGEKWFRGECEASGLDMDCLRFPPAHTELMSFIENSGSTENATLLTIYLELAGGVTQPFRYNQGQEEEADRHIAMMKQHAFMQEAARATGVVRYHRALPTPPLQREEATRWAQEVHEQALFRQMEGDQKIAEAVERAQQMKEEIAHRQLLEFQQQAPV